MKKIKKIFALLIAMVMVLGMSTSVFAASITVTRDDSYAGDEDDAGRNYEWFKVFSVASKEEGFSQDFEGGYDEDDGTAVTEQGDGKVAYTATAAVAAKLGSWDEEDKEWTKSSGNEWFDLAPIAGSDPQLYSVTWVGEDTDAETVQAAAKWLIDNEVYESKGAMSFADGEWTSGTIEDGYYVVASGSVVDGEFVYGTGANLIAVTTDITIKEKNDYPPIVKEEEDEDNKTLVDSETGDPLSVAIGDSIDYTVTVTIPVTAKVGDTIEVWDKPSSGLDYNNDLTVTPATNVTDGTVGTGEIWHKIITVTAANKGTDIVFTYSMTITDDALVDTDRMNEATLKYGDEYESLPHSVPFTTYFSGIQKIADNSEENKLEGVKFDLFEDGEAFNVTLTDDGYYIPGGNSNEVVTNEDGYILIRGLDDDKTYTLTETETLAGYNMLDEDVTLVLVEDADGAFDEYNPDSYQNVNNNSGTVLPSTGGIGTTIFYIIGAILVIGAGVVLVTRRRMNAQ